MAYPQWVAPVAMDTMGGFLGGFNAGQQARQGEFNRAGLETIAGIYDQQKGHYARPQPMGFLGSGGQVQQAPQAPGGGALSGSFNAVQGATDPNLQGILNSLIGTESGGNWQARNNSVGAGGARGHFGRVQFGQARLQDAMNAGAIPAGTTPDAFMQSPDLQRAAENWHFADINRQIGSRGLDQYVGQSVGGVPITRDGIIAMAHLGGIGGAERYLQTGGRYNPADDNGTTLSAYAQRHGNASGVEGQQIPVGSPALDAATSQAGGNQPLPSGVPDVGAGQGQPFEITGDQIASLMASEYTRPYGIQLLEARQQTAQSGGRYVVEQGPNGSVWQRDRQSGETKVLLTPDQMGVGSGSTARPMTAEERRIWGIPENDTRPYMLDADGTPKLLGGSGQTINVSTGDAGAGEFWDTLGGAVTGRYTGLIDAGNNAARTLGQLDQLETLLANTPQGFEAAATQFAGNFGIDLGDAQGVQAAAALINQMVPAQRPPGSGPMSDADLELFKQSVPRLINQPGGNQMIIETMRAINTYDLQAARIVEDFTLRGQRAQTPGEADQLRSEMQTALNGLQNPLENFQQRVQPYMREGDEGGNHPVVTNQQEYDAIPSGAQYLDADGNLRVKG